MPGWNTRGKPSFLLLFSRRNSLLTRLSVGNAGVLNISLRSPPNYQTRLAISPAREIALRSVEGMIN
jgi:hypothetical protein